MYQKEKALKISLRKALKYREDPAKHKLMARRTLLTAKYGITLEKYEELLAMQKGRCAICGNVETQQSNKRGGIDSLRVDHCHVSGKIRGLLCSRCNFGLGNFRDNTFYLSSAVAYLTNPSSLTGGE